MEQQRRGQQWYRVRGADLDVNNKTRAKENMNIFKSENFNAMCVKAGIDVTARQAVKFKYKKGAAYKAGLKE